MPPWSLGASAVEQPLESLASVQMDEWKESEAVVNDDFHNKESGMNVVISAVA